MKERNGGSSARGELHAAGASSEQNEASPEARGLSQTMRDPARKKRSVRQKAKSHCQRSSEIAPANPEPENAGNGGESSSFSTRHNGFTAKGATTNGKRNGREVSGKSLAASDDATGTTPAGDAHSAVACTGRDACAEVAGSFSDGGSQSQARNSGLAGSGKVGGTVDDRRPRASGDAPLACDTNEEAASEMASQKESAPAAGDLPGIHEPLALDAPGFVEEMHARVNLYEVYKELLTADDPKVQQRAVELLLEMKYGRGAPSSAEEPPLRVDVEFPKPQSKKETVERSRRRTK